MVSSKKWGKKKGMFGVMVFALPVTCEALNSWRWQSTHLPMGHSAWTPCLAAQLFLYLINGLYLNPCFFTFALPTSPTLVSEWLCEAELPAGLCPQPNVTANLPTQSLATAASSRKQTLALPALANTTQQRNPKGALDCCPPACHSRGRKAQTAKRKKQQIC